MTGAEAAGRSNASSRRLGRPMAALDRLLYALFSRHADGARHDADRKQYRGTDLQVSFGVYVARVYALSWVAFAALAAAAFAVGMTVPAERVAAVAAFVHDGLPVVNRVAVGGVPRVVLAAGGAALAGALGKRATVALGSRYLGWLARSRRANVRRTLPGAVRYLHALSTGSDSPRTMLRKVADNRSAYGDTAVACRKALNKAALTGSLDEGLRIVARDTPSRDTLAPFLLKFREHADQGADELASYLRLESRMLSHRQQRAREQAEGFLELLAELFIVLLVLPALLVIVLTVMSVLSPELSAPVATPVGTATVRGLLVYGSAAFVLVVGATAAWLVGALRPPGQSLPRYRRPEGALATLRSVTTNPASATLAATPLAVAVAGLLLALAYDPVDVAVLGYATFAVPVGLVAARRARIDDAKDREIKDFVHAVSSHVSLGRPLSEAVAVVARDVDLGALDDDVADLAFNANLTTYDGDLRTAALDRFVDRVGTPLAEQTMGLVTGALEAGSDAEDVFDTLQTEVGRLYHEKKALRNAMLVYVAVGWTTALLIVGIVVAVDGYVIDGFAQLSAVGDVSTFDPNAIDPARERRRFYVVTQATMLASGWFAGMASRGRYDALLHSGLLVLVAYFVFAGVGMT
ncbi:type II secretion system F family protein [Halostella litorea]|uniref:type II secretion system F family protein n=1 Tax=Halostella litorea TaxID=2528831 RepID=UPI0010925EAA|nr:type II secretion system F family protein [Halostella litorea]